jgi:hypothetical protein
MGIDEIQVAPELLRPIKVRVDSTPGRFLPPGSSCVLALRTLPDALPAAWSIRQSCAAAAIWTA